MKITKQEPTFTPVTVTFETKEELCKFFALCNHTQISDALRLNGWSDHIDNHFSDVIGKDYMPYHSALCDLMKN